MLSLGTSWAYLRHFRITHLGAPFLMISVLCSWRGTTARSLRGQSDKMARRKFSINRKTSLPLSLTHIHHTPLMQVRNDHTEHEHIREHPHLYHRPPTRHPCRSAGYSLQSPTRAREHSGQPQHHTYTHIQHDQQRDAIPDSQFEPARIHPVRAE